MIDPSKNKDVSKGFQLIRLKIPASGDYIYQAVAKNPFMVGC